MLATIKRNLYFMFFCVFKHIKFSRCEIQTNFVLPTVKLGNDVVIRKNVKVYRANIGSYTFINEFSLLDPNLTSVGRYCSISHNVKLGVAGHPHDFFSTSPIFYSKSRGVVSKSRLDELERYGATTIEDDVLIYSNAIVVAGIKVGRGSIICSGAVVTKDVEPYSIVGGVPAKRIKYRFDKPIIEVVESTRWWELEARHLVNVVNRIGSLEDARNFALEVKKLRKSN